MTQTGDRVRITAVSDEGSRMGVKVGMEGNTQWVSGGGDSIRIYVDGYGDVELARNVRFPDAWEPVG